MNIVQMEEFREKLWELMDMSTAIHKKTEEILHHTIHMNDDDDVPGYVIAVANLLTEWEDWDFRLESLMTANDVKAAKYDEEENLIRMEGEE